MRNLVLILLAFCLLTLPASAWEQSFEGHPSDLADSVITSPTLTKVSYDNGYCLQGVLQNSIYETIQIDKAWNGKLSFSFQPYVVLDTGWGGDIGLRIYNSSGVAVFDDTTMVTFGPTHTKSRIEFIETVSGAGIECYKNGVLTGSTSYASSYDDYAYMVVYMRFPTNNGVGVRVDDFSSSSYIVSCDESATITDTYQYFWAGFPHPTDSDVGFYVEVYDPEGSMFYCTDDLSNYNKLSVPTSLIDDGGLYTIRLYSYDVDLNLDYLRASRSFEYIVPSTASMSLDTPEVSPSDQVSVFCYGASGYTIQCDPPGANNIQSHTISSDSCTVKFTLSDSCISGTGAVYLRTPAGAMVDYDYFTVIGGTGSDASISFGSGGYDNEDQLDIWYSGLPTGSTIYLQGSLNGVNVFETTATKSGTGIMYYVLTGQELDSVQVRAVYSGEILADDQADIAYGEDYVVSGAVYDAITVSPIENAAVTIAGITHYTDEVGRYTLTVPAGAQTAVITKADYNPQTTTINLLTPITVKNWYLVPEAATAGTGTIYGAVCDYETGAALANAIVAINDNNGTTKQALSRTSTGYYIFDELINGTTWTLTASKSGYDNYINSSVTADGSTFVLIRMVPEGYGTPTAPGADDGSTDSSTAERPGREGARESMESFEELVPGLIGLVVFKVIKELVS